MKFSEMTYERPSLEKLQPELRSLTERFCAAETPEKAETAFLNFDRAMEHYQTQSSLALVRHEIDTNDSFYAAEADWFDENGPLLEETVQEWEKVLLASRFRPELEKKYGRLLFVNTELSLKTFAPEIISELQRENALTTAYTKLVASARIDFEGGVYTVAQMGPFLEEPDDERRRAAWDAVGCFYADNGEELDRLYDELVGLRTSMARKLGFADFTGLGYCRMCRNSYTKEDIGRFREAVVTYIVPLAEKLYHRQAERCGVPWPLSFADAPLRFRSGNARPSGSAEDILAQGKKFYHELSPETAEFIDFLYDNELLDVLSRTGKAAGGFCTELADYRAPFIFANFNGTAGDVEVVTHEAGHAFAGYTARDITPSDNRAPTMESCEIHSMTMEFFAWPWAEGFFGADADKFRYGHLAAAIEFLPYGAMVDHFQHIMYEKPELSPAERHGVWRELLGRYMPWLRLGEVPFFGEGRGWQRQLHIYEVPFYYIDYCLAQTAALQFWALMQKDRNAAWAAYLKLVRLAGRETFTGLAAAAGLASPFGEGLREVAEAAARWLETASPE